MQKKSPRRARITGGCEASSFSSHHGATENGSTLREPSRNVTGPTCPPVRVTKARTCVDASSQDDCPSSLRRPAPRLLPRPVRRERAGVRVLFRPRVVLIRERTLTLPSLGIPGEGSESLSRRPTAVGHQAASRDERRLVARQVQ